MVEILDHGIPIDVFPELSYEIKQELPKNSIVHFYSVDSDQIIFVQYTEPMSEQIKNKIIVGLDFYIDPKVL